LDNVRVSDYQWTVSGHAEGADIIMTEEGEFYGVSAMFSPEASCNVLCQYDVQKEYACYEIPGWGIRVISSSGPLDFLLLGKRYVCDSNNVEKVSTSEFDLMWAKHKKTICEGSLMCLTGKVKHSKGLDYHSNTCAGRAAKYTAAERKRAEEAIELIRKSGFYSPTTIADMLQHGAFKNCNLSRQDIERGVDIMGRPKGYWNGKMHDKKSAQIIVEELPPLTKLSQIAHCDIMFVNKQSHFVALCNPMNLAITVPIASTKSKDICVAIKAVESILAKRKLVIHAIIHDPEKSIAKCDDMFPDINFEETNVNGHVVLAERLIEELKEIIRSVTHSVPFIVAASLYNSLVAYATVRRNSVFHKSLDHKMTPREVMLGRKIDYNKEMALGFGDYVKIYNYRAKKNSMDNRALDAIALYPTSSASGSWVFLHLKTGKKVCRGNWKPEPMSDIVIELLNTLAVKGGQINDASIDAGNDVELVADHVVQELDPPMLVEADPELDIQPGEIIDEEDDANAVDSGVDGNNEQNGDITAVSEDEGDTNDVVYYEALEAYLDSGEEADSQEEVVDVTPDDVKKITRSGKVYIAKISGCVLSASTKKISAKKAMKLHKEKAMDSMFKELKTLNDKGTFVTVDPNTLTKRELKNIIRSFMFLTEKYDAEGNFVKLKSRLVAMGNMQDKTAMEMDVSSPTVVITSIYTIAAIAAIEGRHVMTLDIGGAFLNALIPSGEKILVRLDEVNSELLCQLRPEYRVFLNTRKELVVKLEKALYGCVQSARLWYDNFRQYLVDLGYVVNDKDMCVFNRIEKSGKQSTICFHVDDVMVTSEDKSALDEFEANTINKYENVTVVRGKKHSYLGRMFDFSGKYRCEVSMNGCIVNLMNDENVTGTATSPATNNLFDINPEAKLLSEAEAKRFYSVVQRLLYLGVQFRRDLLLAISFLTTRVRAPDVDDKKKLDRVLKYINGTRDLHLVFEGDGSKRLILHTSVDASFGIHSDGKSHSGYVGVIAGGSVEAKSKKQGLVTKSSTESELVALSDMTSLAIWWREFMMCQGYNIGEMEVEQDNTSCIKLAENGRSFNPMSRHINIRFFFIKDRMDAGEIKLKYVQTDELVADILTKPLQGEKFRYLRAKLMNHVI
jgi:hypothetical protein